jgi:transposase
MRGLTLTQREQARLQTLNLVLEGWMGVGEAAYILGLSERHTWRIIASYRKAGAAGLAHGNRGCRPINTTSEETRQRVITLASTRYAGFNHTHLTELLAEREGVILARSTVRRLLADAGIPSPRHRRAPRHRCRRERMPQEGMLVQVDGSHHSWLEERGPWLTLLLAVDDATGKVPYALFREQEDTEGYFRLMTGIIQQCGIPLAIYSDRHTVFRRPSPAGETPEASIANDRKPTQFGRAMRELGVTQVFAHSPEAKGRVERANGTFQDRLVSELRLAGASTIGEANSILEAFLPRFNKCFGVPAVQPEPAYRPVDPEIDMEGVLCIKEQRRVAKDNTVRYYSHTLQLFPRAERTSFARARVEVQERLDGRLLVCYQGKILTPGEAPPLAAFLRTRPDAVTENEFSVALIPSSPESGELEDAARTREPQRRMIWYEDSAMKHIHRELVKAGMERAREQGKRIGRPRVTERPEFLQQFAAVIQRISPGGLSRRKAAKELAIGYATLKRLLDARNQPPDLCADESLPPPVGVCLADGNSYAEVLY